MFRDRVHQLDLITVTAEPGRVDAGATTNVQYRSGRCWQIAPQQLLRPEELQAPMRKPGQSRPFVLVAVMLEHLARKVVDRHPPIITTSLRACNREWPQVMTLERRGRAQMRLATRGHFESAQYWPDSARPFRRVVSTAGLPIFAETARAHIRLGVSPGLRSSGRRWPCRGGLPSGG